MAEALLTAPEKKKKRRKRKLRATHYIFFANETQKVGCGWRCVCLVKLGTKWAHLYYPADDVYFKLGKRDWERLSRLGHAMDAKGKRLLSAT